MKTAAKSIKIRNSPAPYPAPTPHLPFFPMLSRLAAVFSGSSGERLLAKLRPQVARINDLAPQFTKLDDAGIAAAANDLRTRRDNGEKARAMLCETFALCREAASRTIGLRHFDEQLLGGMALFEGKIAEMKTGEGKTLVATLPVCLEALGGKGVHVVTVNDYLARRDAEWMSAVYRALGLSVGVNLPGLGPEGKAPGLSMRHRLRHQQRIRL